MPHIENDAEDNTEAALAIRPARAEDAVEMVRMIRALAAHVGHSSRARVTAEALERTASSAEPPWRALVADPGSGSLAGLCLYSIVYSTWRGAPGLFVIDLYVDPRWRREGLGARLLQAAGKLGHAAGCRFIRLDVDAGNEGAMRFYERLGFREMTADRIFALDGAAFDALLES
jgi:ribosomal protein S18 acetylase RimI-like enzyme